MMARLLFVLLAAIFAARAQSPSTSLSCPEKVSVSETIAATQGWKSTPGQSDRAFERVSIFNGNAGGKEYELAPDEEKQAGGKIVQTWKLKDYRSMNIFLRCRYHDTPAVLLRDLPSNLATCTLTFALDKKGNFIGKSAVVCR
jgi:hypothetical protein